MYINFTISVILLGIFGFPCTGLNIYNVNKDFKRKNFEEFSYITVDPPVWAKWVTFFITLAITIAICYWVVVNDIDGDDDPLAGTGSYDKNRYRRW